MSNILSLQGIYLDIPGYTTLSRRRRILDVSKKLNRWNRKENVDVIIPPRYNAVKDLKTRQRYSTIDNINEYGKASWKREVGYHQRSLVENTFSRWKTIFGENIRSKIDTSKQVEATLNLLFLTK